MLQHSKPVYIGIPGDIGITHIDDPQYLKPLSIDLPPPEPAEEEMALNAISHKLSSCKKPLVIVDCGKYFGLTR